MINKINELIIKFKEYIYIYLDIGFRYKFPHLNNLIPNKINKNDIRNIHEKYKNIETVMISLNKIRKLLLENKITSLHNYSDLSVKKIHDINILLDDILKSFYKIIKLININYKEEYTYIPNDELDRLIKDNSIANFVMVDIIKNDKSLSDDILNAYRDRIIIQEKEPTNSDTIYSNFNLNCTQVSLVKFFANYGITYMGSSSFFEKIANYFKINIIIFNYSRYSTIIYDSSKLLSIKKRFELDFESIKKIQVHNPFKEEVLEFGYKSDKVLYIKFMGDMSYIMNDLPGSNINFTAQQVKRKTSNRIYNYNKILSHEIFSNIPKQRNKVDKTIYDFSLNQISNKFNKKLNNNKSNTKALDYLCKEISKTFNLEFTDYAFNIEMEIKDIEQGKNIFENKRVNIFTKLKSILI